MPHNEHMCTICLALLPKPWEAVGDTYKFTCRRCGCYILTGSADAKLLGRYETGSLEIAILAHFVQRIQRSEDCPTLDSVTIDRILEIGDLPTPFEQADNLLRFVAEGVLGPGETIFVHSDLDLFLIGSRTEAGFVFVLQGMIDQGFLSGSIDSEGAIVTPTFAGWQRYEGLRRGVSSSQRAFYAMQFGDLDLDHIVDRHFRPAIAQTGFQLFRLDDEPKAGSIDDRIRVEIQNSRFMVADLTHANNGVYWEAGYAEGLGKPVIYTCRDDAFSSIHFDTSHLLTVKWCPGDEQDASERLKATIRATLPDAKRSDD